MTWPTTPIVTTSMDAGTDTPPRDQIKAMADAVNTMIANPPSAGAGRLLRVTVFAPGTHTPTIESQSSFWIVEQVAPGGGGGGACATSSGQRALGAGGSGGGYAKWRVDLTPTILATLGVSIVVGASVGGGSATGGTGNSGGQTSLTFSGSLVGGVRCYGGQGGQGTGTAFSNTTSDSRGGVYGGTVEAFGGFSPSWFQQIPGKAGGRYASISSALNWSGAGGDSAIGFGGDSLNNTTGQNPGWPGVGYGSGGSGAISNNGASAVGGSSAPGLLILWQYA